MCVCVVYMTYVLLHLPVEAKGGHLLGCLIVYHHVPLSQGLSRRLKVGLVTTTL